MPDLKVGAVIPAEPVASFRKRRIVLTTVGSLGDLRSVRSITNVKLGEAVSLTFKDDQGTRQYLVRLKTLTAESVQTVPVDSITAPTTSDEEVGDRAFLDQHFFHEPLLTDREFLSAYFRQ